MYDCVTKSPAPLMYFTIAIPFYHHFILGDFAMPPYIKIALSSSSSSSMSVYIGRLFLYAYVA